MAKENGIWSENLQCYVPRSFYRGIPKKKSNDTAMRDAARISSLIASQDGMARNSVTKKIGKSNP
jgi:hypothetical protein